MIFKNFIEVLSAILKQYKGDEYSIILDQEYLAKGDARSYRVDNIYRLQQNGKNLLRINSTPYFWCCGAHNIANLQRTVFFEEKGLISIFVLLIILQARYENKGIVTLTVPSDHSSYRSTYALACKLKEVLGGTETNFKNPNTSNDVSHFVLFTEKFNTTYREFYERVRYSGQVIDDMYKVRNKRLFDNLYKNVIDLLNQIKKR
jgi:hypothetical protein